jgi:hypothetical protein
MVSDKICQYEEHVVALKREDRIPAVPQSPKPALKMVEPDFKSATASSASLKSFDLVRSMTG